MSYESSCERKIIHHSRREAMTIAKKSTDNLGRKLEAYKCKYCKYWHVGHKRIKGRK